MNASTKTPDAVETHFRSLKTKTEVIKYWKKLWDEQKHFRYYELLEELLTSKELP